MATSACTLIASVHADPPQVTSPPAAPPPVPQITWNGAFDVYYEYNFNRPPQGNGTGPGTRNFDYKSDLFAIGLAELQVARATAPNSRFGFNVKLAFGPTIDLLTSPADNDNKNILQAYGEYLVPAGQEGCYGRYRKIRDLARAGGHRAFWQLELFEISSVPIFHPLLPCGRPRHAAPNGHGLSNWIFGERLERCFVRCEPKPRCWRVARIQSQREQLVYS